MREKIYDLAKELSNVLKDKYLTLVTAESCTGGLLSSCITDIPGSSAYFERGYICYSDIAKQDNL